MNPPSPQPPQPVVVKLNGAAYTLKWDNAATFRADDIGLSDKIAAGKFGYSTLCMMVWVMLDDASRVMFKSPEQVAMGLPVEAQSEAWKNVVTAWKAGTEELPTDSPKNGAGGNEPLRS